MLHPLANKSYPEEKQISAGAFYLFICLFPAFTLTEFTLKVGEESPKQAALPTF